MKGSVLLRLWERYVVGFFIFIIIIVIIVLLLTLWGFASRDVGWGQWLTREHDSCCPCHLVLGTFPRIVAQGSRLGYHARYLIILQPGLG